MNYLKEEFRVRRQAVEGFNRLHRTWQFKRFWMGVVGRKPAELQGLRQIEETHRVVTRKRLGVQSVPVERIRGSLGRTQDFDTEFRPRTAYTAERWIQIAMANARDIELPAVQLVHAQDRYFVVDGHHRVSVARHVGRLEIDANVEDWQVEPRAQTVSACQRKHAAARDGREEGASWWKVLRRAVITGVRGFAPSQGWLTAAGTR